MQLFTATAALVALTSLTTSSSVTASPHLSQRGRDLEDCGAKIETAVCALPDNAAEFSVVTQEDAHIGAHSMYEGIAIGGTLYDSSPGESATVSSMSYIKALDNGIIGDFEWKPSAPQVGSSCTSDAMTSRLEYIAVNAVPTTNNNYMVKVFTEAGPSKVFSLADFQRNGQEGQPNEGVKNLAIFNTKEDVYIGKSPHGRQYGATIIAPFSTVYVSGDCGYVDGSIYAKTLYAEGSALQLHAKTYDGPIDCGDGSVTPSDPDPSGGVDHSCGALGSETAFARPADGSGCFINDGHQRWGWTIAIDGTSSGSTTYDVYAGAGQCDTSAGELVATVTVVYDHHAETCTGSYQAIGGHTIEEFQFYCGTDKYPKMSNGQDTVAPGKYSCVNSDTETTTSDSCEVEDVSCGGDGKIYAIAHAVSCNVDGGSPPDEPAPAPDSPDDKTGGECVAYTQLNFEEDAAGDATSAGDFASDIIWPGGVEISGTPMKAMLYDCANPTGNDAEDLGQQPGEKMVLIISKDNDQSNADDRAGGGTLTFDFPTPAKVVSIGFLDLEEKAKGTVKIYDCTGNMVFDEFAPTMDNGQLKRMPMANGGLTNICKMEIVLSGSGAVTDVEFCVGPDDKTPVEPAPAPEPVDSPDSVEEPAPAPEPVASPSIEDPAPEPDSDPEPQCSNYHKCDCFTCGAVMEKEDGTMDIQIDHCKNDDISWICCTGVDGIDGECDVTTCGGAAKCNDMASGEFTVNVPQDAKSFQINTHDGKTAGDALNVKGICGGPLGGQGGSCVDGTFTAHCLIDFDIATDCKYTPVPQPEPQPAPEEPSPSIEDPAPDSPSGDTPAASPSGEDDPSPDSVEEPAPAPEPVASPSVEDPASPSSEDDPSPDSVEEPAPAPEPVASPSVEDPASPSSEDDPSPCPEEMPEMNSECNFEGQCGYGEESCCGKTYDSMVMVCMDGVVGGFHTDACMRPECEEPEPEPVDCTDDVFLCDDGTTVPRSGPNCEFVCPEPEPEPILCTADVKECSDGSFVSRTGDDCEFAECPPDPRTPPPTAPPSKGSGSGDPHFKTWTGMKYDYHGECDLVLVDNPDFADGLGLRLHIRTTRIKYFSFIEKVALQIGNDVLEFDNDVENFLINGAPVAANRKHHKTMLGEHLIRRDPTAISVRLHKEGKAKIDFHSRRNGFPAVIVDGGSTDIFKGSLGLLGEWHTGKKIARDGKTEMDDPDATAFALEWQVRDTEPMLFQDPRHPQFPTTCTPPAKMPGNRLGGSSFRKEAEEACSHWQEDMEDCIFDVMATRDILIAEEGQIVHIE